MGNDDTKLEPAEARNLRSALHTEMTKVKNTRLEPLNSINSIAFGCSDPGTSLWTQVDDASTHVNATLANLETALGNYHDAFANAANNIKQTEEQVAADARRLTDGVGLINKPFYENKRAPKDTQNTTQTTTDADPASFISTLGGGGPRALEV